MPIVGQGKKLPRFDSLSKRQKAQLKAGAERVVAASGKPFAVEIVPVRSIGNQGDARTYDVTLFLRSLDELSPAQTADVGSLATKIINEVPGIGRVMVDITPR